MKIRYSVTWIPSIFQTSTHVWGKSLSFWIQLSNYFLVQKESLFPLGIQHCNSGFCNNCVFPHFSLFNRYSCKNSFSHWFFWTKVVNPNMYSPDMEVLSVWRLLRSLPWEGTQEGNGLQLCSASRRETHISASDYSPPIPFG